MRALCAAVPAANCLVGPHRSAHLRRAWSGLRAFRNVRGDPSSPVNLSRSPRLVHCELIVDVTTKDRERDYAALYREVGPQLWRAILVYAGGRREVADDAVGEAFARAIESDGTIRRPFPWLYRTAFRIAAAELRRGDTPLPEAEARYEDVGTADLMEALRRLSPSQRAAVYLHYQADLPVREVARLMATSSAAVKVHLHRGRNRLRHILGDEEVKDD